MTFPPARAEDVTDACTKLRALGEFPETIARGLAVSDPDAMRNAVIAAIGEKRTAGLREIVERFRPTRDLGVFARTQSSRLHQLSGDYGAALADLEDATQQFPASALPYWWIGRARCLLELGRGDEAEAVAREGALRFPHNAQACAFVGTTLERLSRWRDALAAWEDMLSRFGDRATAEMRVGCAEALFRLGRIEEAVARLEARVAQAPDDIPAWRALAGIAAQTGDAPRRMASLEALTGRLQAKSTPADWADLARTRFEARDYEAGEAALRELERRFPDSALAERERLRLDQRLDRGQDEQAARVEAGLARFPDDLVFQAQWILVLLSKGRLKLAEQGVIALEAQESQGYALVARLRLELDRGGDQRLRAYLEALAPARTWSYAEATAVTTFLIQHRSPWGLAVGVDLLNGLGEQATGKVWTSVQMARLRIARREDESACALIEAIPSAYRQHEINELRAWAAYRRGRLDEAQSIWRKNLRDVYFGAVDCPVYSLERLSRDLPPPDDGVTAFVVYRNEVPQLPSFLAHHRRLGVRRFVFFDHLSTDDSCAYLLNEPDVVLYQTHDSFQATTAGRRWIAEIVRREGAKGWGLQVDPDECFIYPGWETTPLDRFVSYLDAHGFAGVSGYMLDMFPRRLVGEDGEVTPLSAHRFYDDDHVWVGQVRPPYRTPVGGARMRLFGTSEFLHKTPLWRLNAATVLSPHETTPLALADVTSALLHFKLFNVALRGRKLQAGESGIAFLESDTDLDVLRRHSRYAARLSTLWRADLIDPRVSREISDSLDMTARGLMSASPAYMSWLGA